VRSYIAETKEGIEMRMNSSANAALMVAVISAFSPESLYAEDLRFGVVGSPIDIPSRIT